LKKIISSHLPTWKSLGYNIIMTPLLPIMAYFVFDHSGFTTWILTQFPCPPLSLWNSPNINIPVINKLIFTIFHGGVAHIFACASLHFIFNALNDLKCLLTHKHN
jgi:hypothetical protein